MNLIKISYWAATVVTVAIFAFSAQMYFRNQAMVEGFFTQLSFPAWLVIPLAIAKVLGIFAILVRKPRVLMEWAYAGFFFDATLASVAHYEAGHGFGLSVVAVVAALISRGLVDLAFTAPRNQ